MVDKINRIVYDSMFFGTGISLVAYYFGLCLYKKYKKFYINPLLIGISISIVVLLIFNIDYNIYNDSGKYLSYFLSPATIAFGIPLYEKRHLLIKNIKAIIYGTLAGVFSNFLIVVTISLMFKLSLTEYVTLLPNSITTAMGIDISKEWGGYVTITVAVIIVTGVIGNMVASSICRIFKIEEPVAVGIAIGASAHAIGTSKAMEMGETQGAMSSLSIIISGILTVILTPLFANLFKLIL